MFAKKCPIYGQFRTSTGNFSFFWWYRNRYREKLVPEKVLERVSEKFGTEKSTGIGIENIWYRKSIGIGIV